MIHTVAYEFQYGRWVATARLVVTERGRAVWLQIPPVTGCLEMDMFGRYTFWRGDDLAARSIEGVSRGP